MNLEQLFCCACGTEIELEEGVAPFKLPNCGYVCEDCFWESCEPHGDFDLEEDDDADDD